MPSIIDDIEAVVSAIRDEEGKPYFIYGHRKQICKELDEKNQDSVAIVAKYPLILLRLDIPEPVSAGGMLKYKLSLAIADATEQNAYTKDRIDNVIKPILRPIYVKFMNAVKASGLFSFKRNTLNGWPPHVKIERPYWGTYDGEGNLKNVLTDPLDAIEIIDLEVNKRADRCRQDVHSEVYSNQFI